MLPVIRSELGLKDVSKPCVSNKCLPAKESLSSFKVIKLLQPIQITGVAMAVKREARDIMSDGAPNKTSASAALDWKVIQTDTDTVPINAGNKFVAKTGSVAALPLSLLCPPADTMEKNYMLSMNSSDVLLGKSWSGLGEQGKENSPKLYSCGKCDAPSEFTSQRTKINSLSFCHLEDSFISEQVRATSRKCWRNLIVSTIVAHLSEAVTTHPEKRRKFVKSATHKVSKIVIEMTFDAAGSLIVHRVCILKQMPALPAFLTRQNYFGMNLAGTLSVWMTKSKIALGRRTKCILQNIIISEECTLNYMEIQKAQMMEFDFSSIFLGTDIQWLIRKTFQQDKEVR